VSRRTSASPRPRSFALPRVSTSTIRFP
jgi:hypothetical protein